MRPEFEILTCDVERAYRRARRMVYDHLPVGETARSVHLNMMQRLAISNLERAERALLRYRDRDPSATRRGQHASGSAVEVACPPLIRLATSA